LIHLHVISFELTAENDFIRSDLVELFARKVPSNLLQKNINKMHHRGTARYFVAFAIS